MRRGGRWKVVFATVDTQQESLKVYDAVRAAGYSAGIRPHETHGKYTYDVRLSQLPSKAKAKAKAEVLANALRGKMGVAEPKVTR